MFGGNTNSPPHVKSRKLRFLICGFQQWDEERGQHRTSLMFLKQPENDVSGSYIDLFFLMDRELTRLKDANNSGRSVSFLCCCAFLSAVSERCLVHGFTSQAFKGTDM